MTSSPSPTTTTSATERLEAGVAELRVPEPDADAERMLLKVGFALPIVGVALILVAWWTTSGTAFVAEQIPMLISGGLLGLGLVVVGLGLFIRFSLARLLRFWMARLVVEQQAQTDRMVAALDRIEAAVRDGATAGADTSAAVKVPERVGDP
ncbi:hypothetical protein BH23ACT2_BH23ACT2_13450 [soil metagenome]